MATKINGADIDHLRQHRKFYWTALLQWTDKRPPYHLTTVHLSSLTYFHIPQHTHTRSFRHRLHATSKRLLHFCFHAAMGFPHLPGSQITYLSSSTFKVSPNASSSMKLSLDLHLPLILAESVAPTGLCLYFHYNIEPSGLQIIGCVICLSYKITSSLRTGIHSVTHLRVPNAITVTTVTACCKKAELPVNVCWILLKGFTETERYQFWQLLTLVCKTDWEMRERGLESKSFLSRYSVFCKERWQLHWNAIFKKEEWSRASGLTAGTRRWVKVGVGSKGYT